MKDQLFDFYGAKFTIKVLSSETNGNYTILDVKHPQNIGPALHMHPNGPETFYIIKGEYEFVLGDSKIIASVGDTVFIPKDTPHRFVAGSNGGHVIVISPPELEFYFWKVSELLNKGKITHDEESSIGKQYGQIFLDDSKHWDNQ